MFGLGTWELVAIAGAILLVGGPTLLPRLGTYVARTFVGLRDGAEAFGENVRAEMDAAESAADPELTDGEDKDKVA